MQRRQTLNDDRLVEPRLQAPFSLLGAPADHPRTKNPRAVRPVQEERRKAQFEEWRRFLLSLNRLLPVPLVNRDGSALDELSQSDVPSGDRIPKRIDCTIDVV